jgi:hypothetical protein
MVPFQGDEQFDAAASRHHLRARLNSGSTKADGGSACSGDNSGYNTRARFTTGHYARDVAESRG